MGPHRCRVAERCKTRSIWSVSQLSSNIKDASSTSVTIASFLLREWALMAIEATRRNWALGVCTPWCLPRNEVMQTSIKLAVVFAWPVVEEENYQADCKEYKSRNQSYLCLSTCNGMSMIDRHVSDTDLQWVGELTESVLVEDPLSLPVRLLLLLPFGAMK